MILIAGQSNACQLLLPLAKELLVLGCSINIIDGSAGGTALLSSAANSPGEYWLNTAKGVGAPLGDCLEKLDGVALSAVWWIQGENEALFGPVLESDYLAGLIKLREIFSTYSRASPVPFVVSPVAGPAALYPYARPVLAAQYRCQAHGFILGPEYYDLDFQDEHLTEAGRGEFAKRAAPILAKLCTP